MHKKLLDILEYEVESQCKFMIIGAELLNSQLVQLPYLAPPDKPPTQDIGATSNVIWFALQGMLVSAANMSKLLWGSKRSDDLETRRPLRESVQVDETSPLYSRQLRNDFEHFDERLEAWFAKSTQHTFVGRSFGATAPNAIVVPPGNEQPPLFGNYDPPTATVTFWDRSVQLRPLIAEVERILEIVEHRYERRRERYLAERGAE